MFAALHCQKYSSSSASRHLRVKGLAASKMARAVAMWARALASSVQKINLPYGEPTL